MALSRPSHASSSALPALAALFGLLFTALIGMSFASQALAAPDSSLGLSGSILDAENGEKAPVFVIWTSSDEPSRLSTEPSTVPISASPPPSAVETPRDEPESIAEAVGRVDLSLGDMDESVAEDPMDAEVVRLIKRNKHCDAYCRLALHASRQAAKATRKSSKSAAKASRKSSKSAAKSSKKNHATSSVRATTTSATSAPTTRTQPGNGHGPAKPTSTAPKTTYRVTVTSAAITSVKITSKVAPTTRAGHSNGGSNGNGNGRGRENGQGRKHSDL